MEKKWITTSQAAALTGVTSETIRNLCASGVLSYKKRHHLFYVNKDEVLKHEEQFSKIEEADKSIEKYIEEIAGLKTHCEKMLLEYRERAKNINKAHGYNASNIAALSYFAHEILKALSVGYKEEFTAMEIDIISNYIKNGNIDDPNGTVTKTRARQLFARFFQRLVDVKRELEVKDDRIKRLSESVVILDNALQTRKRQVGALLLAVKSGVIKEDINVDLDEDIELDLLNFSVHESLREKLVDTELSVRALNCLKAAEIETLLELVMCSPILLLRQRNFGRKSLTEIREFLEQRKLHFEMTNEEIREYSINQLKLDRSKVC